MEIAAIFLNSKLGQFNFLPWLTCTTIPPDGKKWEKKSGALLSLTELRQNTNSIRTLTEAFASHCCWVCASLVLFSFHKRLACHIFQFCSDGLLVDFKTFQKLLTKEECSLKTDEEQKYFRIHTVSTRDFLPFSFSLKGPIVLVDWNFLDFAVSSKTISPAEGVAKYSVCIQWS